MDTPLADEALTLAMYAGMEIYLAYSKAAIDVFTDDGSPVVFEYEDALLN